MENNPKQVTSEKRTLGIMTSASIKEGREDATLVAGCRSLEDIPLEEAKARIKAYFELHHGEVFDYADLVEALCIPLPSIVDACRELEQEGKIAGVD